MNTKKVLPIILVLSAVVLSACATAKAAELDPTDIPVVQSFEIVAEG